MKPFFFIILLATLTVACEPQRATLVISSPIGDVRLTVPRAETRSLYAEGDTVRFIMHGSSGNLTQLPVGKVRLLGSVDSVAVYEGKIERISVVR